MLVVTTTGYIVCVFGPFFSDNSNNDASILKRIMINNYDDILNWIQENDIRIPDRGFRDSLGVLKSLGIDVAMPSFLGRKRKQFDIQDANNSRFVTMLRWVTPLDWQDILKYFRGSELQSYFTKILEENLKPIFKRQHVDQIPRTIQGLVRDLLDKTDELDNQDQIYESFDLSNVKDRQISDLSGEELQRFACAMVCIQKGDIFVFDESSSYLDSKQRLKAPLAIRNVIRENR
ncbi:unnamed protein product [Rotaria sp. Silwood2]|nr:unnamed protein product [Rotaria sp. Silwood2]CAF4172225.1 unnamed protein product [Rotaria sp. Silwood2]